MQIDKFSLMTWFVLITGLTRSLSVLKLGYREIDFITSSPDINVLDYKKISDGWMPTMLTPEVKLRRMQLYKQMLTRHEKEGESFPSSNHQLRWIMGSSLWPWMEIAINGMYPHHSPKNLKFWHLSLLTVLWDWEGIIHMEFLQQGYTIYSSK